MRKGYGLRNLPTFPRGFLIGKTRAVSTYSRRLADKSKQYHGDCSYPKSATYSWIPLCEEAGVPIEVMDLCAVHFGPSIGYCSSRLGRHG